MAAPVTENYLSVYREFLKEFTSSVYANDPLPVKVTGYLLDDADLEGEIIDWTRQYLSQRSCPPALATSIARSVLAELPNVIKDYHELRSHDEEDKGPHYDPLRLMHAVVAKVRAVCERYLLELEGCGGGAAGGPAPLASMPAPLPGPPFVSTHAIKNHRRRMEDRHVSIEDLHALFGITTSPCLVGYYAIFDGHHGHEAAAYSAAQLHCLLVHSKHYPQDPEAALKDAFFRADEIFIKKCASSKFLSGTTALVALVRHRESLHVAWVGDSLGILVKKGGKITQFVTPHTADRKDERDRILSAGGSVFPHFGVWRINGTLAISRAIGDLDCKPHVSALADVVSYPLDGSEHFIILACDGLWDCVTEAHATDFVYDHLRKEPENHADLSKLLVNLAKSRASNDNISVVVVLLSSVEDILATAPPPASLALDAATQEGDYSPAEASPADGLAPVGAPPCQLLVNGTMDVEAATAAADPSSNPFATPFKASPIPGVDSAPSPDGLPADGGHNNHHDNDADHSAVHDEDDGLAMDFHHGLHHSHHNGHGANDIMTSSFYGNGDGNNRDLFGDPSDLGPETHVDLLDEDGMMMDMGQAAEEEYKARAREFGMEEDLDDRDVNVMRQQHGMFSNEGGFLDGGDYSPSHRVDAIISEEQEGILHEEGGENEEDDIIAKEQAATGYSYNPFKGDDWSFPKTEPKDEGLAATQFEEEPSTRQHSDGERQDHLMAEEVEVIQSREEPAVEKGQVVPDEEGTEVGGGSGLEEGDDDSEEEWKYVSTKRGEGGAVVPEAVSPEAALPDETSCSPALPEQELLEQRDTPSPSPALPPRVEAVPLETAKVEEFETKAETSDLKAEEVVADDDKFCQDLGFEVVQKTHVEEVVCEASVSEKAAEEDREPLAVPGEVDLLGKPPQHIEEESEDSMMESRLNPDAAEFVPVSPTQIVNAESYPGAGDDFDTFKKEADECPGEISEEPAVTRTPKAFLNVGLDDNTVLSSSFDHDVSKPSEMFQEEPSPHVPDLMTSANEYHADDDNKENISHEGENKENMSQQITVSDVSSALNRSFEVLEEHSSGNNEVSDFFGSSLNTSKAENKDEYEIVSEQSGHDIMSELVCGTNEPEKALDQGESEEPHKILAPHQIVDEAPSEPAHISHCEEISFNQSSDFMHSSQAEDLIQRNVSFDERKDDEQNKDPFQMEFSPVKQTLSPMEPLENTEMLVPEETAEHFEPDPHPNLAICPMKMEGLLEPMLPEVKEQHILPELSSQQGFGLDDFLNKKHPDDLMEDNIQVDHKVNLPLESSVDRIQALEAEVAEFHVESPLKDDQEFKPVEVHSVDQVLEPVCTSPALPTTTTELSSIIEGSQALSLEEKVPAVEENILKIDEEIAVSFNVASEVEVVQEVTPQSLENIVCTPSSEIVTSPEPMVEEELTKEQGTAEVIPPGDVASSESTIEEHPKDIVKESIPEGAAVAGAAAAVAAVAGVAVAAAAASAASTTKPAAKKPAATDKKPLSDKSKVSSTTAAKAKSTKPPVAAAKTAAPKKPAAPSTNKTAPTPAARTTTAERKPLTSTAKPTTTSKPAPTTTTSLSSKPKTLGAKPATALATRTGVSPRTSAPPARPPTSGSAAPKTGASSTTSSKPAPSRPSTAPPKTTEPKKLVNGDASKPASATAPASRTSLTKKPSTTTSSTTASKTSTTRVPLTARAASSKSASEAAKTKPATGTVNGAVPKTTPRTSLAPKPSGPAPKPSSPATKSSAPTAPARTKAAAPTKTTPAAPGIAKKAKESVNKHISATRLSGVSSPKQSAITKTESPKSAAHAVTKGMTNGTPGKKPELKSNSKEVEEEEKELRIYPCENGITSDCNEMRKELDGVVGIEDGVHEAKEQMVLMGNELSIGEAV